MEARVLRFIATVALNKGDLKLALDYLTQSLVTFEDLENKNAIAVILGLIGQVNWQQGNHVKASECFKRQLALWEEQEVPGGISGALFNLVQFNVDQNALDQVKSFVHSLKALSEQHAESRYIKHTYYLANALLHKQSPRVKSKAQAQELLELILADKEILFEYTVISLLLLSDLLLSEFRSSGNAETLKELTSYITRLHSIAKNQKAHNLLAETYLLQAKLSLLQLDIKESQRLLKEALVLAEGKDLQKTAQKITNEYDTLIDQLSRWQQFKDAKSALPKIIEVSQIESLIGQMVKNRIILQEEEIQSYITKARKIAKNFEER